MGAVGILGGTFDPVHVGHLALAEAAREGLGLARVHFVVAAQPPHKSRRPITAAEHRWRMVALATHDTPHFLACRCELDRQGPSYTIDTVRDYARRYPAARLHLILGSDALLELDTWREPQALLGLVTVVVAVRPGTDRKAVSARLRAVDGVLLELMAPDVSATEVRSRIAAGLSVDGLVPPSVVDYIARQGLYSASQAPG